MTSEPNGLELAKEVEQYPTLDEYLARNPKHITDDEIRTGMIKRFREDRALFIKARKAKKEKK